MLSVYRDMTTEEIEDVLTLIPYGHLGASVDGKTIVLPLAFTYEKNVLLGHTYEGFKIEFLRKNPKVCFQVEHVRGPNHWSSVLMWGTFTELSGKEAVAVVQKIVERFSNFTGDWRGFLPLSPESASHSVRIDKEKPIFFRIDIEEKCGRFEKTEHRPNTNDVVVQLLRML